MGILENVEINNYTDFNKIFPHVVEVINDGLEELQVQIQQHVVPLVRNNPWLHESTVMKMFLDSLPEAIFEEQCEIGKYAVLYKTEYENNDNIEIVIAVFDDYFAAEKFVDDLINFYNQFMNPITEEEWEFYDKQSKTYEMYPMWDETLEIIKQK